MVIRSINPATEEVLAKFEEFSPEQVESVLREAQQAFEQKKGSLSYAETTY